MSTTTTPVIRRRPTSRRTLAEYLTLHPNVIVSQMTDNPSVPSIVRREFVRRDPDGDFKFRAPGGSDELRRLRTGGKQWDMEFSHDIGFTVIRRQSPYTQVFVMFQPDGDLLETPIPPAIAWACSPCEDDVLRSRIWAALDLADDDEYRDDDELLSVEILRGRFPADVVAAIGRPFGGG